jgi:hypothetical protein
VVRALLLLSSAVWLSSALDPCNVDLPGYDAGSGDDGSSSPSGTIGSQCTTIVSEFCTQAINRCALAGFTQADCVTNDMPQCCSAGNTCDQKSTSSSSDVSTCTGDIDQEDCNFVVNSTLPPSCSGLLHP